MPLECFVDVGMHMIFRGVTKDYIELMSGFMKDHKLETKFHEMINPFLLDIQAMRLDWCQVKPLPNKQWLAEDEMRLARIFPFVYGKICLNMDLGNSFTSPRASKALEELVHSFHVMVCIIMSPRKPSSHVIDAHV